MEKKDRIKALTKAIKLAHGDRRAALYNHNYEHAANIKKYIDDLITEKEALKEELSKD